MNELLFLLVAIAIVGNLYEFVCAKVRVKMRMQKNKNEEQLTVRSAVPHYANKKQLKIYHRHVGIQILFFGLLAAVFSLSLFEFVVAMSVVVLAYYITYRYYRKQTPVFYLSKKGVVIAANLPFCSSDQVARKTWEEVRSTKELSDRISFAGDSFRFHLHLDAKTPQDVKEKIKALKPKQEIKKVN